MLKRMGAMLLLSFFLLSLGLLSACSPTEETSSDPTGTDSQLQEEITAVNHRYLTLWSWQIPDTGLMESYAKKAVECGFTAVDLGVLWAHFEPIRGHCNWTWLDAAVKIFSDHGLGISLQPLLWSKDLSWAEELVFQENRQGVFSPEDRGSFVSFTDGDTLDKVEDTLQSFALHAREYGPKLLRWGLRLSAFGEGDYSVNADLDYSESSIRAFCDYLKEIYGDVSEFARVSGLEVAAWSDLEQQEGSALADAAKGDWRRFRSRTLVNLLNTASGIFRGAKREVPIVFMLGTFGNGMNHSFSGVTDLWTMLNGVDYDILGASFSTDVDPAMALSCLSSLTSRALCMEVDGAGVWSGEDEENSKSRVALCSAYGVNAIATANFTFDQLEEHKSTLLAYKDLFPSEGRLPAADGTKAILIFSSALVGQSPARSFNAVYGEVWSSLSENGSLPVRFLTEDQIAAEGVPEGITDLYCGALSGPVPLTEALARTLAAGEWTLHGADLSFCLPDGSPLPAEVDLAARLEGATTEKD